MNDRVWDVVVVGGGHNGLAAATLLARGGRSVLLVERRGVLGGIAAREEFAPGAQLPGLLHDTDQLRPGLVKELQLEQHGLRWREREPELVVPRRGAPPVVLGPDGPQGCAPADAAAWTAWKAGIQRLRPFLERVLNEPPPDPGATGPGARWDLLRSALGLRRLGKRGMAECMRTVPMCVADWLNESFETPELKSALALSVVSGTWSGPWSAGTAGLLLFASCTRHRSVEGGPAALIAALTAAANDAGATLWTDAPVERIAVEDGRVTGVVLHSGEVHTAQVVVATCDPIRMLNLLRPADRPETWSRRLRAWRVRGTTAKLHLLVDGTLDLDGRPFERMAVVGDLDDLERAFDSVKYGEFSTRPALDVWVPSVVDPSLAPDGQSVVSILAHFAPHDLAGGWTEARRTAFQGHVMGALEQALPGLGARVLAHELLVPVDLEGRYGLSGGQIQHGEPALDQSLHLRPAAIAPVAGLFLGSAACHPGGGLTCAPGALAARAVLGA